jgi:hypothetical protein
MNELIQKLKTEARAHGAASVSRMGCDVSARFNGSRLTFFVNGKMKSAAHVAEHYSLAPAEALLQTAREKYRAAVAAAEALQAAHAHLYLFDEAVSVQNAADGLKANEGITLSGYDHDWCPVALDYVTNNIHADTGMRAAEAGIDYAKFGIRF